VVQERVGGTTSADLLIGFGLDERCQRAGKTILTDQLSSVSSPESAATDASGRIRK
jgi:hypothetical protein